MSELLTTWPPNMTACDMVAALRQRLKAEIGRADDAENALRHQTSRLKERAELAEGELNKLRAKSHAFTLIELLVAIAVIALLIALLLPALAGAIRPLRRDTTCRIQLGQIAAMARMYEQDNRGLPTLAPYPAPPVAPDFDPFHYLNDYAGPENTLRWNCPADPKTKDDPEHAAHYTWASMSGPQHSTALTWTNRLEARNLQAPRRRTFIVSDPWTALIPTRHSLHPGRRAPDGKPQGERNAGYLVGPPGPLGDDE